MAEFVYDPYGAVIGQRSYGVHPPLKAGHRGLFAESLTVGTVGAPDADLGDPESTVVAWVDGRVLVPNERVVYHMRNRAYDPPPLGRAGPPRGGSCSATRTRAGRCCMAVVAGWGATARHRLPW